MGATPNHRPDYDPAMFLLLSVALAAQPPAQFAGTWTLDAAHSSDVKPLLSRIGVPTFMASASENVTQVITLGPESITVQVKSFIKDATETMSLATGSQITGSLYGMDYVVRPEIVGSAIVATGTIKLNGVATPFESKRFVAGDTMHSVITIGTGDDTTVLDRVFTRTQ